MFYIKSLLIDVFLVASFSSDYDSKATDSAICRTALLGFAIPDVYKRQDEMRSRQRVADVSEINDLPSNENVENSVADSDMAFRIHLVLHRLEEPYKEVFQLRVFGELSFSQIAAIFGKTESWARVTYHRAKLKIQERMDEKHE